MNDSERQKKAAEKVKACIENDSRLQEIIIRKIRKIESSEWNEIEITPQDLGAHDWTKVNDDI